MLRAQVMQQTRSKRVWILTSNLQAELARQAFQPFW
jgi:hypothetical protein